MKCRKLTALGLLTGLNLVTAPAFAQAQPELDLTIQVMEEGQQPDGFINRIELPPPEAFDANSIEFDLSDSLPLEDAIEATRSVVDSVEEAVTDQVRETISIDGSAPEPSPEQPGVVTESPAIPESVERILAEDLPLEEPLSDVVDLGELVDVTADAPLPGDTIELDSGDTIGATLDGALTVPAEEVDALGASAELIESLDAEIVDSVELPATEPEAIVDSLDGLLPETADGVEIDTDSLLDAPLDSQELDQLPGLEPEPVEDLLDSLDAVPNL